MKRILYFFGMIVALASCSSQKYAANFQKSNASFGYGELVKPAAKPSSSVAEPGSLLASTSPATPVMATPAPAEQAAAVEQIRNQYKSLNKAQKKEFRKELTSQLKKLTKANKKAGIESTSSVKKTQQLDHDLKLAAVFGAIGIVALIIGTNAFVIIGGIALIIGVVFFVLWLVRQ